MAKYNLFLNGENHLHISCGNNKLGKGIHNISLLPSDTPLCNKKGDQLVNISGTCGGCCSECKNNCYAVKTALYHHNSCIPAWGDNTLLARHNLEQFKRELLTYLDKNIVGAFRWHVSGEIPSRDYLEMMLDVSRETPTTQFYVYTKRYEWIEEVADRIPDNLHVTVSVWHSNYNNPCGFHEFIYDDGTEDLENVYHCPAVDKNGRETGVTCAKCKRCIHAKKGEKTAVYAHQRRAGEIPLFLYG